MEKSLTNNELAVLVASGQELTVLDVRRKEDFDKDPQCLAHAQWKDPAEIDQWLPSIAADREVVIYCVRGGLVSRCSSGWRKVVSRLVASKVGWRL